MNKRIFLITAAGLLIFIALILGGLTFLSNLSRRPSTIVSSTQCDIPSYWIARR